MIKNILALAALAALPTVARAQEEQPAAALDPSLTPAALVKLADGKPVDADEVGHAAPLYDDFDGDKVPDLLVGQFGGGKLQIYRNEGSAAKPVLKNLTWFKAGADLGVVPAG